MLSATLNHAAGKIQSAYSNYRNRQWFRAYRHMIHTQRATRIQSIVRMFLGRQAAIALRLQYHQEVSGA